VGRRDKLALLQDYHCDQDIKVVVISGLGGVGKSKLAFEYAMGKKHSTNCVWLRGETKETILHSLNNLALLLNIPTEDVNKMQLPVREILSSISSKISSTNGQPWLIVMDNVDSEHEYISTVLGSLSKQPNVFTIVTSVLRNLTNKRSTAAVYLKFDVGPELFKKYRNDVIQ
jgi:predicted ATP-dependent serine protease